MNFKLPTSIVVSEKTYVIRWDFKDILTILEALADPELDQAEKAQVMLGIFYPDLESIPDEDLSEAMQQAAWFIDGGMEAPHKKGPRLMDWGQDFPWIVAPINRVLGRDVRVGDPLHWWTFLSAYYEIGDCTFAQIVRVRNMQAKGKRLDKADREWVRENADLVRLKSHYSSEDDDLLSLWTKGGLNNAEQ